MQEDDQHLPVCTQTSVQTDQHASKYKTMPSDSTHGIVRNTAGVSDNINRQTDRHISTDRQAGRQAGRQSGRQAGRQAGRQTDRRTDGRMDRRTNGQGRILV